MGKPWLDQAIRLLVCTLRYDFNIIFVSIPEDQILNKSNSTRDVKSKNLRVKLHRR